ncbi:MAG: response regulator [Candidatus Binatia bacterium]
MKVLIVDDSETNRMLLQNTLAAQGMDVLEAEDGLQALDLLKREPVDAVISDILMPKMDGYRLCEAIRRSNQLHCFPFVVYSATYLSDSDHKLALRVGVDKFITKPAPAKELIQIIQEVLASAERRGRTVRKAEKRRELFPLKKYAAAVVRKLEETNAELISANATLTERAALASFAAEVSSALTQGGESR